MKPNGTKFKILPEVHPESNTVNEGEGCGKIRQWELTGHSMPLILRIKKNIEAHFRRKIYVSPLTKLKNSVVKLKENKKMLTKKITSYILIVLAALLIGYDVWATYKGYNFTITSDIRSLSKDHPTIPLSLGIWAGYTLKSVAEYIKKDKK